MLDKEKKLKQFLWVGHVLAKLPVDGVGVVDTGVAKERDVSHVVSTHKYVVPVELILNESHLTVVLPLLPHIFSLLHFYSTKCTIRNIAPSAAPQILLLYVG